MVYKKKSYLGLGLWVVAYLAASVACVFLPLEMKYLMTIFNNILSISVFALILIIYLTEKVYWITGVTYTEALNAGPIRRKAFAKRHLVRFGIFTAAFLIYSVVSLIVGIPYGVDIAVVCVGIVAVAISTINIKL